MHLDIEIWLLRVVLFCLILLISHLHYLFNTTKVSNYLLLFKRKGKYFHAKLYFIHLLLIHRTLIWVKENPLFLSNLLILLKQSCLTQPLCYKYSKIYPTHQMWE